jgi:SAM-dependent methyltransferase
MTLSLAAPPAPTSATGPLRRTTGLFGTGGAEPYESALGRGSGLLTLLPAGAEHGADPQRRPADIAFHVGAWCLPATTLERSLLQSLRGPLLDVGCGPGRILSAAAGLGIRCAGVDTSPAAVELARKRGAAVLQQSVFDPLPYEGLWGSALLLDGNIGIGGNPRRLLARMGMLLSPGGVLLVEVDPDPERELSYCAIIADPAGRRSEPFPWSVVGAAALARAAGPEWKPAVGISREGRVFSKLVRRG